MPYRFPATRPTPDTLDQLADEQLELYELPAQRRAVLVSAMCLVDIVDAGARRGEDVTALDPDELRLYVAQLADEVHRLAALNDEHTRRLNERVSRMATGGR